MEPLTHGAPVQPHLVLIFGSGEAYLSRVPMNNKKVLVLGTGVVGVSTALALYERGFDVEIVEQSSELGQGASGDNGGQLSYNHTDSLASPDILWSLPKLLMGLDQAFRLKLSTDWDFLKWSMSFLRNCTTRKSDKNTLAVLALALKSRIVLQNWCSEYRFEFNLRTAPKLLLYESDKKLAANSKRVELKNRHGADQNIVHRQQVLNLEPALDQCQIPFVGGVYSPGEQVGDVRAFVRQVVEFLVSSERVKLSLSSRVSKILLKGNYACAAQTQTEAREFDYMVICGGYESSKFAASIGLSIPVIYPVAGYSITYPTGTFPLNVSITDTASRMVYCRLGEQIRIAGMADVGLVGSKPNKARIDVLRQLARERFPHIANYSGTGSPWMGVRPMTANSRPIIERTAIPNVFINSGHGMLGWTLAPGSAQAIADLIEARQ